MAPQLAARDFPNTLAKERPSLATLAACDFLPVHIQKRVGGITTFCQERASFSASLFGRDANGNRARLSVFADKLKMCVHSVWPFCERENAPSFTRGALIFCYRFSSAYKRHPASHSIMAPVIVTVAACAFSAALVARTPDVIPAPSVKDATQSATPSEAMASNSQTSFVFMVLAFPKIESQ
jgi:hypothetical protein